MNWRLREVELHNLYLADFAYTENKPWFGDFLIKSTELLEMIDFATEILPISGTMKDVHRAFMGEEPLTGEKLSPMERSIATGMAILLICSPLAPRKSLG